MKQSNDFREIFQTMGRIGGVAGFGLSVVTPLIVCVLTAVWLMNRYDVGEWVLICAVAVGLVSSGCGAYRAIRAFLRDEARRDAEKIQQPLMPKRDTNEAWHVPPEDSQKLE